MRSSAHRFDLPICDLTTALLLRISIAKSRRKASGGTKCATKVRPDSIAEGMRPPVIPIPRRRHIAVLWRDAVPVNAGCFVHVVRHGNRNGPALCEHDRRPERACRRRRASAVGQCIRILVQAEPRSGTSREVTSSASFREDAATAGARSPGRGSTCNAITMPPIGSLG